LWTQFRSTKNGKTILGNALTIAYSELYETYPSANTLGKDDLTDFFKTRTTAGSLALAHTVNTFKNLADYAEFNLILNAGGQWCGHIIGQIHR